VAISCPAGVDGDLDEVGGGDGRYAAEGAEGDQVERFAGVDREVVDVLS